MQRRLRTLAQISARNVTTANVGPDQVLPATDHRSWTAQGPVRLRISETGSQSFPPISVPTLFRQVVERVPDNLALRKRDNNGNHIDWTYSQYYQQASLSLEKWLCIKRQMLFVCLFNMVRNLLSQV